MRLTIWNAYLAIRDAYLVIQDAYLAIRDAYLVIRDALDYSCITNQKRHPLTQYKRMNYGCNKKGDGA